MAAVAVAGEVSGGKYLKAAAQLIKNSRFGRAFEKAVLQKLGLSKNAEKVAGAEGKSIPDARTDTQDIEVKGGDYVTDSKQMRIQREAGSTLILRTLSLRLILSRRSVHVEAQALQP